MPKESFVVDAALQGETVELRLHVRGAVDLAEALLRWVADLLVRLLVRETTRSV